eukprot:12931-Heterococcus_DN1.PRE.1
MQTHHIISCIVYCNRCAEPCTFSRSHTVLLQLAAVLIVTRPRLCLRDARECACPQGGYYNCYCCHCYSLALQLLSAAAATTNSHCCCKQRPATA